MTRFVCAGAGFLLAVLWFDLMFDVQVRRLHDTERQEEILASIAGYYGRVTVAARPMNRLVAVVMVATLASIVVQITRGDRPGWVGWVSLILAAAAILLAAAHTVPSAVRLGSRAGSHEDQRQLARAIYRDHLLCAAAIAGVLALQLAIA